MRILVLDGDGIGPEITEVAVGVIESAAARIGAPIALKRMTVGQRALASEGTTLPHGVWQAVEEVDGILLAPLSTASLPPVDEGGINVSAAFRSQLDLFANLRPSRRPGRDGEPAIDLMLVRENSEGMYAVRTMHQGYGEFMPDPETCLAIRKVTVRASERIARVAFEEARQRRGRVTIVHKSNVLKMSDGLFVDSVRNVGLEWPDVAIDEIFVDAAAAALVSDPERFDVIVTTNLFGDILSNVAAAVSGGLGGGGSLNQGATMAMAQAGHGSAPDIAGKDIANPVGLVRSAAMLLRWFGGRTQDDPGYASAGALINGAIDACVADAALRPVEMGGKLGTQAFGRALIEHLDLASLTADRRRETGMAE